MKFYITPQIIVDELGNEGYNILSYTGNFKRKIERVRFFNYTECTGDVDTSTIYLLKKEQLVQCGKELCSICIGENNVENRAHSQTTIFIDDTSDILQLYNLIENLIHVYTVWNNRMNVAIGAGDFQLLAQLGRDIFHNPLFVHDNRFNYIMKQNWIAGQTVPEYNRRTGLGMIPVGVVDELKKSKAYQKTIGTHGAHIYEDYTIDSYRVLYVNIWENEEYRGRLCIDEINSPILPGQFRLAEYYAECVNQAMSNRTNLINKQFTELEQGLSSLLTDNGYDYGLIIEPLQNMGWHIDDDYLLCYMKTSIISDESAKAVCYDIENRNPESCAFVSNHKIYILLNITYSNRSCENICQSIYGKSYQEPELIMFSDIFAGVDKLLSAYKQINALCDLHDLIPLSEKQCHFSRYALQIILHLGMEKYGKDAMYPKGLKRLEKYDVCNNTDFSRSLKYFLKNDNNITRAANELCIHRTTLIYRIERIQEITGLDLNDYEIQLYLGLFLFYSSSL